MQTQKRPEMWHPMSEKRKLHSGPPAAFCNLDCQMLNNMRIGFLPGLMPRDRCINPHTLGSGSR